MLLWTLEFVILIGRVNVISVTKLEEGNKLITFIWSCTSFLVPKTDGSLLFLLEVWLTMKTGISSACIPFC